MQPSVHVISASQTPVDRNGAVRPNMFWSIGEKNTRDPKETQNLLQPTDGSDRRSVTLRTISGMANTFIRTEGNSYLRNNNNSPKVEPFVSASECVVYVIVRPVGDRHSHAEACVYTYTILSYTYVVYHRSYYE